MQSKGILWDCPKERIHVEQFYPSMPSIHLLMAIHHLALHEQRDHVIFVYRRSRSSDVCDTISGKLLPILMRVCDSDNSIAEAKSKTLISNPGSLGLIIVSLLGRTQLVLSLFLFAIDVSENLSVRQNDHHGCRAYRYQNLVSSVVIWFVVISVDFLLLKSVHYPDSMSEFHLRAAATLPIS